MPKVEEWPQKLADERECEICRLHPPERKITLVYSDVTHSTRRRFRDSSCKYILVTWTSEHRWNPAIRAMVIRLRAAGICYDVLTVPPGEDQKRDAVCCGLEHYSGETVNVFVPYVKADGMRRPVSAGCDTLPMFDVLKAQKRRPAMKKTSTVRVNGNMIFKGHKLTIGVDLGDRWSNYCVLDEAGEVLLEQKLATTPEAMKQTFERIPRGLMALETGTHSPWLSRLLRELGHEVLVAHAQKVELISKSNRKDDRHDARTLARLARIDPELLGPVRHRSAKAQIHLTVIRAREFALSRCDAV